MHGKFKTITCFLPAGRAKDVLNRLRKELAISSTCASHARGTGLATKRDGANLKYVECEMLTALIPVERADEVFSFIFYAAGIDQPHAGMVMMTDSPCAEMLVLAADVPDEA